MNFISIFFFGFIGIRLIVAMTNWLARSFLPRQNVPQNSATISVLIPARNEEKNLTQLLAKITAFKSQPHEIIIYDDGSTDHTADIVLSYAKKFNFIKLIRGSELPHGWLGKNHACFHLAQNATGEFLLFLDADVHIGENVFSRAVAFLKKYNLDLLSIFPKQILVSLGEKLSIPLMNWILLSLLPLPLVRRSKNPAFSAANGQFMLFRAESYKKMQPHEKFKAHKVEDIAISRFYKKSGLKTATLLGDDDIQCRMYTNLGESINGFSKNVFQFFGNSKAATIFFALLTTLAPFYIWLKNGPHMAGLYIGFILLLRILISLASKQNVLMNLFFFIPQHIIFLIIIFKAVTTHHKKELLWKGRNILQASFF
jgi:glycosyltransferase involved in cell wall biosynthesis